jgi:hypothetical protein
MTNGDDEHVEGERPRTKVERLIESYELDGIGAELERRWTGESGERDSLRTLADDFNERLLERSMREAGMNPIAGEVANRYRHLTGDEVSRGVKTEVTNRLEQNRVDVSALRQDFVSYQAIRTYLREIRGASHEKPGGDRLERARTNFTQLSGRTTAVVEQKLDQLVSAGDLSLGKYRVRASITVYCEDCETQYEAHSLLEEGGCECETER